MARATFEPQPLSAPLNDTALTSLRDLTKTWKQDKQLRRCLDKAVKALTDVTGELNDRAYERKTKHAKAQMRTTSATDDGTTDGGDAESAMAATTTGEAEKHEEFQRRVETLTKTMDTSLREIIDDANWLDELPEALEEMTTRAENATQTQRTNYDYGRSPTPVQSSRPRKRRNIAEDDDEEEEDEPGPQRSTDRSAQTQPAIHPADTPHILLTAALERQARNWTSKTLTEKYAHTNDYTGWYRVLYDAHNPGESAPPMPARSLWFAAEEGREILPTQRRGPRNDDHDDDDDGGHEDDDATEPGSSDAEVEIAAEKVRLKCPITLLPYVDPVTSSNCNHSYERAAIQSMLKTTTSYAPFTPVQLVELSQLSDRERAKKEREIRVPQVKCPECNVTLTEGDLAPNPALKRRVARLMAMEERRSRADELATSDVDEEDEDDNEGGRTRGTLRRPVGVGSSPLPPGSTRQSVEQMKRERLSGGARGVSRVPQTQASREPSAVSPEPSARRSRVVDVEEED